MRGLHAEVDVEARRRGSEEALFGHSRSTWSMEMEGRRGLAQQHWTVDRLRDPMRRRVRRSTVHTPKPHLHLLKSGHALRTALEAGLDIRRKKAGRWGLGLLLPALEEGRNPQ